MHVLIAYDISDNATRVNLFSYLKEKCIHSQKSVFECEMTCSILNEVYRFVKDLQINEKDSILFYPLCKLCSHHVIIIGHGVKLVKTNWMIV